MRPNTSVIEKVRSARRILIIGDAGFGKSTLARELATVLGKPVLALDDCYWQVKYTEPRGVKESVEMVKKMCSEELWILEGNTQHLYKHAIQSADVILVLRFNTVWAQWMALAKRHMQREDESWGAFLEMIFYATRRRFGICNDKVRRERDLLAEVSERVHLITTRANVDALLADLRKGTVV